MNRTKGNHTGFKLLAAATAGLATLGICGTIVYNKLIVGESAARSAFAAIDSALRARAAILPALVAELQNCTAVQELAAQLLSANDRLLDASGVDETIRADAEVTGAMGALLEKLQQDSPLEGYNPEALQTLRDRLREHESAIAAARKCYNEAAIAYNRILRRFPGGLVARLGSFPHYRVFTAALQP